MAVLTTENRDTWAKIRSDLVNDGNAEALKTIDSAIFVISLEDGQFDEENPTPLFKELLGSCGTSRCVTVNLFINLDFKVTKYAYVTVGSTSPFRLCSIRMDPHQCHLSIPGAMALPFYVISMNCTRTRD